MHCLKTFFSVIIVTLGITAFNVLYANESARDMTFSINAPYLIKVVNTNCVKIKNANAGGMIAPLSYALAWHL